MLRTLDIERLSLSAVTVVVDLSGLFICDLSGTANIEDLSFEAVHICRATAQEACPILLAKLASSSLLSTVVDGANIEDRRFAAFDEIKEDSNCRFVFPTLLCFTTARVGLPEADSPVLSSLPVL